MKSHKYLDVGHSVIRLAEAVYQVTRGFPTDEQFGMTTRMRRVALLPCGINEPAFLRC